MIKIPLVILFVLAGVILELSLVPLLGVAGASLSVVGIIVASLALAGLMEEALLAAAIGGILFDLSTPAPFGRRTLTLGLVWLLFFLTTRLRWVAPQIVVVALAMAATGLLVVLPELFQGRTLLLAAASVFLHALAGTFLFPVIRRFLPHPEVV